MNKKTIMMAVLCAVASTASAQLEKGKILMGGSAGFGIRENPGSSSFSKSRYHNISPMVGYFVSDNLVVGAAFNYGFSKEKSYETKNTNYGISPFARYYLNISPSFKFFGELRAGIGKEKYTSSDSNDRITTLIRSNNYSAAVAPGLTFLPAKRWSVDLRFSLLNFNRNERKDDSPNSENTNHRVTNQFSFGLTTVNPMIGVNFHL